MSSQGTADFLVTFLIEAGLGQNDQVQRRQIAFILTKVLPDLSLDPVSLDGMLYMLLGDSETKSRRIAFNPASQNGEAMIAGAKRLIKNPAIVTRRQEPMGAEKTRRAHAQAKLTGNA